MKNTTSLFPLIRQATRRRVRIRSGVPCFPVEPGWRALLFRSRHVHDMRHGLFGGFTANPVAQFRHRKRPLVGVWSSLTEQPQPAPAPPAEGEAAPEAVPGMDGFHADLLQELQHQYGDLSIPDGEGGQIRVSDMIEGMRAERARVDSDAKLHEVAAACALRSGGGV